MASNFSFVPCILLLAAAAPLSRSQLVRISGRVFCTIDDQMGANGASTPVFASKLISNTNQLSIRKSYVLLITIILFVKRICMWNAIDLADVSVQLQRGSAGTVVASATTNLGGVFSLESVTVGNEVQVATIFVVLEPIEYFFRTFELEVITPLASCDSSLPAAGALRSSLKVVGTTVQSGRSILDMAPSGFMYIAVLG